MDSYEIVSEAFHAVEPAISCGLAGGFLGTLGFDDSSRLVHGCSGCGFAMRYGLSQHWKSFIPCPVTSLHENDVIFGGEKLLKKGIEDVEKIYPSEVLFILTSCATEIIGDDIESVVLDEAERRSKRIVAIDVGGASGDILDGYNRFLYKTISTIYPPLLDETDGCSSHSRNNPQIDILGIIPFFDMFFRGDMQELKRVFDAIGIRVNSFFTGQCSIETMRRSLTSDLAVSLNKNIGERALKIIRRYTNIRTDSFNVVPIGFEYSRSFFFSVSEMLGLNLRKVSGVLDREEEKARETMIRGFDFAKVMYNSGRVAIIGETSWVLGLTNFLLNEVGMRSTLIALTNNATSKDMSELDRILNVRNNQAKVLINQDNYLVRKYLSESQPNIVFGRSIDRIKELENTVYITWQFPSTNRFILFDRPYLGYRGIGTILDDIVNGFSSIWY